MAQLATIMAPPRLVSALTFVRSIVDERLVLLDPLQVLCLPDALDDQLPELGQCEGLFSPAEPPELGVLHAGQRLVRRQG